MKLTINLSQEQYEAVLQHKKSYADQVDMDTYLHSILSIGLQFFVEAVVRRANAMAEQDPELRKQLEELNKSSTSGL